MYDLSEMSPKWIKLISILEQIEKTNPNSKVLVLATNKNEKEYLMDLCKHDHKTLLKKMRLLELESTDSNINFPTISRKIPVFTQIIESYPAENLYFNLIDFQPDYVVSLNAYLSILRSVDQFYQRFPAKLKKFYLLDKLETNLMYKARISREKAAFSKLQTDQSSFAPITDRFGITGSRVRSKADPWKLLGNPLVRNDKNMGSKSDNTDVFSILVDTREFRSELPPMLYHT